MLSILIFGTCAAVGYYRRTSLWITLAIAGGFALVWGGLTIPQHFADMRRIGLKPGDPIGGIFISIVTTTAIAAAGYGAGWLVGGRRIGN